MPVLETSFHLSFPFIFMEEDTLYLLPEQAQSGELILYKCTQFPHQWEIAATLLKNTHCYDPVLIKKEGKWWLFVTERLRPCGSSCVYDYLYYSDVLSGPWIKHPMNPISTDCRYTRAGGAIFQEDNQLIRVIQDCSQGYGYAINLVKINELSETTYHQELIGSIDPKDYKVDGLHTLNFSEKFTVIDSRTKKCTWFI